MSNKAKPTAAAAPAPVSAPAPAPAPVEQPEVNTSQADQSEAASQQAAETSDTTAAPNTETPPPAEAPAPAPAPAAPVVQEIKPAAATTDTEDDDQAYLDRQLKDVPESNRYNALRVLQYIREMDPKLSQSTQSIGTSQQGLYKAIANTINREDTYFRQVFGAIVGLFNRHSEGVFNDLYVFRGVLEGDTKLSDDERTAFTRLVYLIKVAGPVKTRAASLKQVDMANALKFGLTEPGRERVKDFFGA